MWYNTSRKNHESSASVGIWKVSCWIELIFIWCFVFQVIVHSIKMFEINLSSYDREYCTYINTH